MAAGELPSQSRALALSCMPSFLTPGHWLVTGDRHPLIQGNAGRRLQRNVQQVGIEKQGRDAVVANDPLPPGGITLHGAPASLEDAALLLHLFITPF